MATKQPTKTNTSQRRTVTTSRKREKERERERRGATSDASNKPNLKRIIASHVKCKDEMNHQKNNCSAALDEDKRENKQLTINS